MDGFSRRDLLRRSSATGVALAAASVLAPAAGAARRRGLGQAQRFFDDSGVNFEALFAYGSAAYGAARR